jgi:hypothetical protein
MVPTYVPWTKARLLMQISRPASISAVTAAMRAVAVFASFNLLENLVNCPHPHCLVPISVAH